MKLSKETLNTLANLALINSNLIIKPGTRLASCSAAKTLFAFVDVKESFDKEFGIYDLKEFLGAISVFDDPEIEFGNEFVTISDNTSSIKYVSADCSILISPKGQPKLPSVDVEFTFTAEQLMKVVKVASILKVGVMSVIGDGTDIMIKVHDKANPNSNQMSIKVGSTTEKFAVHFKIEQLKMPAESYSVQISKARFAQFTGTDKLYIIGAETDSSFS